MKQIIAIFCVFGLIATGFSQFDLSVGKVKELKGITAPRIVGTRIIVGEDSANPSIGQSAIIKVRSPFEFVELDLERDGEEVDAEQISESKKTTDDGRVETTTEWIVTGDGEYKVTARGFDRNLGIKKSKSTFVLGPPKPKPDPGPPTPGPTPGPAPTPVDNLTSKLATDSRDAMVAYSQAVARDCETMATEIRAGKYKTVIEASNAYVSLDTISRAAFKQSMNRIMQPKLGNSVLPTDAAETFVNMAQGFKAVK